ncbi:MAG TPA: class II aldolase and adducin N-terminal domain-containing protein [Stellaceae bacterium]|nr:class II aldolase and adducin N-terminal domain-containing protein [Stellaceae bacterium]
MANVTALKTSGRAADEQQLRIDLAAVFRMAARLGWHEAVANHFSLAVSADGKKFLMNPKRRHFSKIKASELLLLDTEDKGTMNRPNAPDASAWCIHGHLHARVPQARCILHVHPPYTTAIACLADPEIKPIDQNTARFYNRVAIDLAYGGIADHDAEGERLADAFGNHSRMMMGNHGVVVLADTVAEAFHDLYYLERACQTLILAYSTGQKLNIMPHKVAEHTAQGWLGYKDSAFAHFAEMKAILDEEEPSYAE